MDVVCKVCTYRYGYDLCGIRHNLGEVVRDNHHFVTINTEFLNTLRTSVDDPYSHPLAWTEPESRDTSIRLAGCSVCDQRTVEIVLSIDEIIIRERNDGRNLRDCQHNVS
jgi:hypothetical protein